MKIKNVNNDCISLTSNFISKLWDSFYLCTKYLLWCPWVHTIDHYGMNINGIIPQMLTNGKWVRPGKATITHCIPTACAGPESFARGVQLWKRFFLFFFFFFFVDERREDPNPVWVCTFEEWTAGPLVMVHTQGRIQDFWK